MQSTLADPRSPTPWATDHTSPKVARAEAIRVAPPHVLMLSDVYFPRINGVSTSIQTFRQGLEARGVRVTLVAPDYGTREVDESLVRVPSRHVPMDPEDRMMHYGKLMQYLTALRGPKVDLVHIQTPFVAHYAGTQWARRLNIPTVESYHTFFEEYFYHYVRCLPRAGLRFLARRFSTRQCNQVNALVVPSQAMLRVLRGYGVTTQAQVIPTGLDLSAFRGGERARFRQAYGIAAERPVLLYVGRVVFEKNIEFLFQVVHRLRQQWPDILLVVAGEGPAVEPLKFLAVDMKIAENILFVGYLDRRQSLLDCYRAGDVFVFASRTETQGLVLLEAMALGLPVVSTAVMGTTEVLRDQHGCLVAREDVADFAAKVDRLLTDEALRRALSASAIEYAAQWSEDAFTERLLAYYHGIIGTRAASTQRG